MINWTLSLSTSKCFFQEINQPLRNSTSWQVSSWCYKFLRSFDLILCNLWQIFILELTWQMKLLVAAMELQQHVVQLERKCNFSTQLEPASMWYSINCIYCWKWLWERNTNICVHLSTSLIRKNIAHTLHTGSLYTQLSCKQLFLLTCYSMVSSSTVGFNGLHISVMHGLCSCAV